MHEIVKYDTFLTHRLDIFRVEGLRLSARAPLYSYGVGIEAGSERVRKRFAQSDSRARYAMALPGRIAARGFCDGLLCRCQH